MIFGRPINLWLGVVTAGLAVLQISLVQLGYDPVAVATILGSVGGLLGALITLVANQPPTLTAGQTYNIETPKGEPNYVATVANPPAASQPVVDPAG